jgi:hypothetical protein
MNKIESMTERFKMHADLADQWMRCYRSAVDGGDEAKAGRCIIAARQNIDAMRETMQQIDTARARLEWQG